MACQAIAQLAFDFRKQDRLGDITKGTDFMLAFSSLKAWESQWRSLPAARALGIEPPPFYRFGFAGTVESA